MGEISHKHLSLGKPQKILKNYFYFVVVVFQAT
jgi:hypothetical protein